ncbi:B3 domain-containing protein Os01g0723500-like [Impatiens glandulifera]|uniref:B3 domain-containing protein Os01g0723500-like n=1 Tax=Impatiens glandulifera TaxID=253017 RepID=UPI001FB05CD0|nr:B3 domain-containing protein Os01g0723500-like [Impatiens glandulifera]XP_047320878.1 B3 domain-containing protein Os01g0723500-like [Impatiens glandulifera]
MKNGDDHFSFFNIILPGQTKFDTMRLPQRFTKKFAKNLPQDATLRGPYGKICPVKLRKDCEGYLRIVDGWELFYEDCRFEGGEFTVFTYDGNSHFEVRVFEMSGIERMGQFHGECSNNIKNNKVQKIDDAVMLEKAGIKPPYLVKRLMSYHCVKVFVLNFSNCSATEHLPSKRATVVLLNKEGRSWDVTYIPKKNQSTFSRGWVHFVNDNGLKEGDLCVFEILSQYEIRVHVFP